MYLAVVNPDIPSDGIGKLIGYIIHFYSHGIDEHPMVFATFVILGVDIFSGMLRSWVEKRFSTTISRKGIANHAFVFVTVLISYPIAVLTNVESEADMFIYYLFFSYATSIIKNAEILGIKIPFISAYVSERADRHKEVEPETKEKDNNENVK